MSKVDEIREHINDGRTIRRIEVKELLSEYDRLTAELAESQRREKAAVADLEACMHYASPKNNNTCNFCANDLAEYPEKCIGREDFVTCCPKWRGPQEAGKAGDAKG